MAYGAMPPKAIPIYSSSLHLLCSKLGPRSQESIGASVPLQHFYINIKPTCCPKKKKGKNESCSSPFECY